MPLEEGLKYFRYTRDAIIENYKLFWFHSLLALGVCLFKPISIPYKIMGITLLGFSFLTIVPGYYFYGHYWIEMIPGLALVAGLTCYSVLRILQSSFKLNHPRYKYIYLIVFGLLTAKHLSALSSYYSGSNGDWKLHQHARFSGRQYRPHWFRTTDLFLHA